MRLLLLILCLGLSLKTFGNEILNGRVIGVLDGDTLSLLTEDATTVRIRLAQIDAPEKRQAFGQRSKQSLSDLAFDRQAEVQIDTLDRYGRLVGKVRVGGQDVNLLQIQRGMAWVYRRYAKDPQYFEAEDKARKARVGLWADPEPTPPWIYRHPKRAK